jgi:GT2 family glycosyltransferase
MTMKLSVLIVTYNSADTIEACLKSVLCQTIDFNMEVLVVDNGSSDGTEEIVQGFRHQVVWLPQGKNLGFAAGNNAGFLSSEGKYILLVNPDAELQPMAILRLMMCMDAFKNAGVVGGRLLGQKLVAREIPSVAGLVREHRGLHEVQLQGDLPRQVPWVCGAFCMYRRNVLEEIGFFDERFFMYYEETDLCLRIKQSGYQVWLDPKAQADHVGGGSAQTSFPGHMDEDTRMIRTFAERSRLLFFRKHYGLMGMLTAWLMDTCFSVWRCFGRGQCYQAKRVMAKAKAMADTKAGCVIPAMPWRV